MQENLFSHAAPARAGLGWPPGIIRRFPGSNHNFHITPPRLGFTPGRFSFLWDYYRPRIRNAAQRTRSASQDTTQAYYGAGLLMLLFREALGGHISGLFHSATHILETRINSAAAVLRPLVGNPDALCGIGRRWAGNSEMIRPGLWMAKNGPKSGLFFKRSIWQKIGPDFKSRKSRESREPLGKSQQKNQPHIVVGLIVGKVAAYSREPKSCESRGREAERSDG